MGKVSWTQIEQSGFMSWSYHLLCSGHFTCTVALAKWVLVNSVLGGGGGSPVMDQHLIQGEVEILLVASCF